MEITMKRIPALQKIEIYCKVTLKEPPRLKSQIETYESVWGYRPHGTNLLRNCNE
jgi:hypothetical protein